MKQPKEVTKLVKDGFKVEQVIALGDVRKFFLSKDSETKTVTIKNNIVVVDLDGSPDNSELLGLLTEEVSK